MLECFLRFVAKYMCKQPTIPESPEVTPSFQTLFDKYKFPILDLSPSKRPEHDYNLRSKSRVD